MKKIILGISSSISAYKSCDLVRYFVHRGYSVFPVLTHNAEELVSRRTLEVLSGNPVYSETFAREQRVMGHIELKQDAALLLIAPATANIIAKCAQGIADDLLSTTFLSVECPVMVAPAMNPAMWNHPAVKMNLAQLEAWGVHIVVPDNGVVVCGEQGTGRLASIESIGEAACAVLEK